MVMAQSLFMVLRQKNPDVRIDVLAPGWSRPLLERMPEVRHAIDMPLGHGQLQFGLRRSLGITLREQAYDQAILLPNSLKSALTPFFARIPRRTGFVGELRYGLVNDIRRLDKQRLTMTVQRFVALGLDDRAAMPEALPRPHLVSPSKGADNAMLALGLASDDVPILGLCPGAEYGPAKRWPHFADLAAGYLRRGWRVWLFGSDKDRAITRAIREAAPGCDDLAGRTSLAQAIDLLARCDAVVSNDSGLMHVAAALARPLVAIYGSSDPGFTPPLAERVEIVRLGLECSPCFARDCPLGHTNCLNGIRPAVVGEALERLL
ncbi:MAG: lipopolysaccharide heptosyltransferase II [Gammaproteobacteria bacterium]|nr:lipopolysaccharide heptosyltransferase II [Gammaproteobacteria bacterium]MCP5137588.1 lipopolysaccharide heptosyltransferase II [Gammaproteobacteria bacterium]